MPVVTDLVSTKLTLFQGVITARLSEVWPYLLFLLTVLIVGAYEGNDWRRQRLYAGYYRLIFRSSVLFLLITFAALTLWIIEPAWFDIQTLMLSLMVPCFALGWTVIAGRPVLR